MRDPFRSGRVVETSDESPSIFVSREDVRLAIMISGEDVILGSPNEGDERKSGHPDGADHRSRSRIYDIDGAIVTFGSMFNAACMERNKMGSPANAKTSPDGEKETVCSHPLAGLANSPQTVPNGSLSPQNVGAGLKNTTVSLS